MFLLVIGMKPHTVELAESVCLSISLHLSENNISIVLEQVYIIYSCYELGQTAFTPSMFYFLLVIMGVVQYMKWLT